jgi:quinolinate synthase
VSPQVARDPMTGLVVLEPPQTALTEEQAVARIPEVRRRLGTDVLILGHHYQRDEVIQFADLTGDSYGLSREAAARHDSKYIVFCGVHFMAETADILAADHQRVILPDMTAGCSMADMAEIDQVEAAWEELDDVLRQEGAEAAPERPTGAAAEVMPITYVNSTAAVKAFVGERGGAVCTSSNASAVFDWGLARRPRLFFFPDQHLGRNTAFLKRIPLSETLLWDPALPLGGNAPEAVRSARIYLWRGHCQVHTRFRVEQVRAYRAKYPDIKILVHPECPLEVVREADYVGSTSYIIKQIEKAPAGSRWAIGTEIHLVNRLQKTHPDKTVFSLLPGVCLCSTMNRVDPQHLLSVLESLVAGTVVNEVAVREPLRSSARAALDRMLAIS